MVVSSLFHLVIVFISQLSNLLLTFRSYLVQLAVMLLLEGSSVSVVILGLVVKLEFVRLVGIFQCLEVLLLSLGLVGLE